MKVLVVGLGSIASRHIKNIKTIKPDTSVAVLRQFSKEDDLGELNLLVDKVFFDKDKAIEWKPDVTFVTNPASLHVKTALEFARIGSNLFIEKPLSNSLENIDSLLKECNKRKLVLMVGYVMRFLEPLKILKKVIKQGKIGRILSVHASVGQYLPQWRPSNDYSNTVSAKNRLGGGVVFELSHEFDYLRWIIGEVVNVSAQMDKLSNLKIDVEDVAEITLRFANGAIGSIHLDMLDKANNRYCRVIGTKGTAEWLSNNGKAHSVRLFSEKKWSELYRETFRELNGMYLAELRHFFHCVRKKSEPLINGIEARRVVEIALAAKSSAKKGKVVKL